MLVGAAYAIFRHRRSGAAHSRPRAGNPRSTVSKAVAPIAVGLLVLASVVDWRSYAVTYPWIGLAIAVLTVVILSRWAQHRTPSGRAHTLPATGSDHLPIASTLNLSPA